MAHVESTSDPSMKVYVAAWLGSMLIVVVETGLTYAHLPSSTLLASLLALTVLEAAIALRYFMNLKYERPLLFWTLIPALVFAFVMMNQVWADALRLRALRFPGP
jgi:cytochrome c oxidase subunit IV